MDNKSIHAALFGVAIGDALGVPVEFEGREQLKKNPVTDYLGFMIWSQPPGAWSDDSSMTFCLGESLCNGYNPEEIGAYFVKWYTEGYWGAHNKVFDIGCTTRLALRRIIDGEPVCESGATSEKENGNGSLMRILPLVFYLYKETDLRKIYQVVSEVSGITHAHFQSVFACFIYIIYALELIKGEDKKAAYSNMQQIVLDYSKENNFKQKDMQVFERMLKTDISSCKESSICSSGYVIHSLEAAFWCILKESSFHATVLKAVNLGHDTDTTGAITGGLAGLLYGWNAIPERWVSSLARKDDIFDLCNRLTAKYV